MPVSTNRSIDVLRTSYLTANVLNIEEPPGVMAGLLTDPITAQFPGTDNIEFGRETLSREGAPFIPMEAAAVFVGDRSRNLTSMEIPNIAMRKSIRAGDFAHDRTMGDQIFLNNGGQKGDALEARIDRYQRDMVRRLRNTEEWWVSQILSTGVVTYSDSAFDAFTFSFGRDAAHTVTLGTFWDSSTANFVADLQLPKKLVASAEYLNVTVALCGSEVSALMRQDTVINARLDNRNLDEFRKTSYIDVTAPYAVQGALTPIGRLNGIDFWEYDRAIALFGGSPVAMVDPKWIYLFATGSTNGMAKFFAPYYDLGMAKGRPINGERFSKSWEIDYPSQAQLMVQSRPMIAPMRPDFCVAMKVISG